MENLSYYPILLLLTKYFVMIIKAEIGIVLDLILRIELY